MTEPDEQRLLSLAREGRPEASAEIVRTHYEAVYRFLVHLTRDVHRAEDLTQETFATAWRKIAGFRGGASLATWLHRIAYTKFIDTRRSERRATGWLGRAPESMTPAADPFEAAAADDEARRLYEALEGLDDRARAVVVLHYLQGLSYREMAAVLDEPSGTVKWRTSDALARLRELLRDEAPDHGLRTRSGAGPIS